MPRKNEKKRSFVFYLEWAECLECLSQKDRLAVYEAIVSYAQTGEMPTLTTRKNAQMAFAFIVQDMRAAQEKWEKTCERRRQSGRLGGIASGNKRKQKEANEAYHEHEHEHEHDHEHDHEPPIMGGGKKTSFDVPLPQRREEFISSLKKYQDKYPRETLNAFCDWWTEPTPDGTRMRFEMQPTWSTGGRLRRWSDSEWPQKKKARAPAPAPSRGSELLDRTERMLARQDEAARRAVTREEYLRQKEEGLI